MSDTLKPLLALAARRVFTIAGTWLATKGLFAGTGVTTETFVGACMVLAEVLYEGWNRYGTVLVDAELAKLKGVHPGQADKPLPPLGGVKALLAFLVVAIAVAFAVSLPVPARAQQQITFKKIGIAPAPAKPAAAAQKMLDPLSWLRQFSATDLQAALDDANAQTPPNITSIPCWTFLLGIVKASPSSASSLVPGTSGVASAIQKALDDQLLLANWLTPNGTLDQLNVACAPLINKINATFIAGGTALVGAIATGPAGTATILAGLQTMLTGATALPAVVAAALPK